MTEAWLVSWLRREGIWDGCRPMGALYPTEAEARKAAEDIRGQDGPNVEVQSTDMIPLGQVRFWLGR